jgi:hypothetical protein
LSTTAGSSLPVFDNRDCGVRVFAIAELSTDPCGKSTAFDRLDHRRALQDRVELSLKGSTVSSGALFQPRHDSIIEISD